MRVKRANNNIVLWKQIWPCGAQKEFGALPWVPKLHFEDAVLELSLPEHSAAYVWLWSQVYSWGCGGADKVRWKINGELNVKGQEHAESPNTLKGRLDSKILKEKLVEKRKSKWGDEFWFQGKDCPLHYIFTYSSLSAWFLVCRRNKTL